MPIVPLLICLMLSLAGPASAAGPTAGEVRQEAERAVEAGRETQAVVEKFLPEEASLIQEAESLTRELNLAVKRREKVQAYLADQKAKVAELERRLEEMARIEAGLEPLLDRTLERLDVFVAADTPFLPEERQKRLADMANLLHDYDAGLPEKARRLLEALMVEARYGVTADAGEAELALDGKPTQAHVLRLGRTALFALGLDGRTAWRLDKATGQWEDVSGYARDLNQAAEMAQRKRVVSLVELPVGMPPAEGGAR